MNPDVPVRDAATVVLLRDGLAGAGIEAWLLTRVKQMVFAAGMSVFPGGRVDDADAELPFAAGAAASVANRFGCDQALAQALLGAAVRETFEETGVLLTTPSADLSAARTDVEAGRVAFGDLLREHELMIGVDVLHPWSRWITPPGEAQRRYDTRFFVGALPDGAEAANLTSESSEASWVPIGLALAQAQRGERRLMPPTISTLVSILEFPTVAEVLASAASRELEPVQPRIRIQGERFVAELADGSTYELPRSLLS